MNAHVFSILEDNLQTMIKFACYLMFEEMSIIRLIVLKALRNVEATAGQAILHIMPWSLCFVVCVKSRRNLLLSI
jgi:hypothetical protein